METVTLMEKSGNAKAKKEPDLVTIRVFSDELEANFAKSTLESEGVDSMLSRDNAGGMEPPLSLAQGIKLIVRNEDAERARAILSGEAKTSE